MKKFDDLGKILVKTFFVLLFVSSASSAVATLADLRGRTPDEVSVTLTLSKPANTVNGLLTLVAYDADFPNEGELVINGNTAIPLFGAAGVSANDRKSANITISTPASYWRDGNNTLLFRHTRTQGFVIDGWSLLFEAGLDNGDDSSITSGGNTDTGNSGTSGNQPGTGSVNLSWVAPVARADGAAIALSEIAGYTVHYGTSSGNYPDSFYISDGSATAVTVTDLPAGTYYLVVTTRDTDGRESRYSSMATKQTQ